jgi:hypothetical protein
MRVALVTWAIVSLLGCGGAASRGESSTEAGAPNRDSQVETGGAGPADTDDEHTEQGSSAEEADCDGLRQATLDVLAKAVAEAPTACADQSDCVLYGRRPACVYDCGLVAAVSDSRPIDSAVDRVNAELCPESCVQAPSSCGGGLAFEEQPMSRCDRGQCVMRSWQSVFELRFQATVHPVLTSHCQECHNSSSTDSVYPFADSDPAIAMNTANTLLEWARDSSGWHISNPRLSRLVRYVEEQQHHCWTDCEASASALAAALVSWSHGD